MKMPLDGKQSRAQSKTILKIAHILSRIVAYVDKICKINKHRPHSSYPDSRKHETKPLSLSKRHHRFSTQYLGPLKGALVDFLYDLRQAIERWHHFFDDVFDLVRIHGVEKITCYKS